MAKTKIELDHGGVAEILTSDDVRGLIDAAADTVLASVVAALPSNTHVIQTSYTTDRAAASVSIRDIRGRIWQARDGVLTRAATAAGLEVGGVAEIQLTYKTKAGKTRTATAAQIANWTRNR